jgi:hypothetical protein
MALTEKQKKLLFGGLCILGGLAVFGGIAGLIALAGAAAASTARNSRIDNEIEPLEIEHSTEPIWRQHERDVVARMQDTHADSTVLDNPRLDLGHQTIKPDVVVIDEHGGVREVREAKAVQTLTHDHVRQAIKYDEALGPQFGTTIDVREETYVSAKVLAFAHANGVGVEAN